MDVFSLRVRLIPVIFLLLLPTFLIGSRIPDTAAQETTLFQHTWGGPYDDWGSGIKTDGSGNIYVTGGTPGAGGNNDVLLLKYNSSGSLIWQRTWGGSGDDWGNRLALDASTNIYVAGVTGSLRPGVPDALLLKFNSSGGLIWARTWNASGSGDAINVVVDSSADIYVSGYTSGDVVLLKFNSTGGMLWQRSWGGPNIDMGLGLAVDSSDNVYVTGVYNEPPIYGANAGDVFLLKFSSNGSLLWQRIWGGVYEAEGLGIAADRWDNVYVTGFINTGGGYVMYAILLKFNQSGNLLWQRTWGGSGGDEGEALAIDPSGNIYMTGLTYIDSGTIHVPILKFDSAGSLLWQRTWGGIKTYNTQYDEGLGIAVDASGRILVTGHVLEPSPYQLYTPNGTLGTSTYGSNASSVSARTLAGSLNTPSGIVGTSSGSATYAGMWDLFLFAYATQNLTFYTSPPNGSITFSGTVYANGQRSEYGSGIFTATANAPLGYMFSTWASTGGLVVEDRLDKSTNVTVTGSGSLTASFTPTLSVSPAALVFTGMLALITATLHIRRRSRKMRHPSS